ncbi:hypothetical protein RJ640_008398 [Escallonia rubra]|uniref:Uncharacterized protein n=1 Tax=Escallonia rubra TaxID=112253 RepID=A0AA88UCC1_9ASTE|nr:hypothetical protein RJ640_008398 [Escallonia rubra]
MMQSFISSSIWIAEQHALQGASYLQVKSCARGQVGLAVPVAIACFRCPEITSCNKVNIALQVFEGSNNIGVAFQSALNTVLHWDSGVAAGVGINKYLLVIDN